jgi:hypothetical protein
MYNHSCFIARPLGATDFPGRPVVRRGNLFVRLELTQFKPPLFCGCSCMARPGPRTLSNAATPPRAYFTAPPEPTSSAFLWASSFSITSPTVKLSGRCLGGNCMSVCIYWATSAPAGTSMKTRSARHFA